MRLSPVGNLTDELQALARRVHSQLIEGDRFVYATEDGSVYASDPLASPDVPAHWIAGTFRLGESFEALVEDLACLRHSRFKDWILE